MKIVSMIIYLRDHIIDYVTLYWLYILGCTTMVLCCWNLGEKWEKKTSITLVWLGLMPYDTVLVPTMVWSGHIHCFYNYLCARALGDLTKIWSQKERQLRS